MAKSVSERRTAIEELPAVTAEPALRIAPVIEDAHDHANSAHVLTAAALHSIGWLFIANLIGVWMAILLLYPPAGRWLGEWSYGRWTPVHLNFQLYGWISFPLVAWALRLYRADRGPTAIAARAALILWSMALTLGGMSWLRGASSGKLFLDWSGYARVLFPTSIFFLWLVLAAAYIRASRSSQIELAAIRITKVIGLAVLLLVPFAIYLASDPGIYPAVNPDSGGPTGASQLESSLVIVLILFLLPYGLTQRRATGRNWIVTSWFIFAIEALLCLGLGRADVSHHRPVQFISLGSLLVWVPLIPAYFSAFTWPINSRPWRFAVVAWWALLVPTGWCLFLPGILDHLKFTDGLVGHSLMAMAGFVSSLLVLILVVLLDEDGDVFNARWAFIAWQGATFAYVIIMLIAGWIEGGNPAFTMVPSTLRSVIYGLRLVLGIVMTAASADWLVRVTLRMRRRVASTTRERTMQYAASSEEVLQ